jgi:uncharacterized protein (DUF433 family)
MNTHEDQESISRIVIDPNVCFGRPHIRGHRVLVSLVLGFLASGSSISDVLAMFPGIEETDIVACLDYNDRRRAALLASKTVAA